jgi:hypothetical protein
LKDVKEINQEVRAIKERAKALSGFWIGELAAAIYALEWVAGKRDDPPSETLGGSGGGHERIAENLTKLVEKGRSNKKPPAKLGPRRVTEKPPAGKKKRSR